VGIALKAVQVASGALKTKFATPGSMFQAEKETVEAASALFDKAAEERNTAVTALRKAVDAKFEVSDNAATISRAAMVGMRAVVTEAKTLIGETESITKENSGRK